MANFTPEKNEKAKTAKSELEQLNPKSSELSDDELSNVAGGVEALRCGSDDKPDEASDNVPEGGR